MCKLDSQKSTETCSCSVPVASHPVAGLHNAHGRLHRNLQCGADGGRSHSREITRHCPCEHCQHYVLVHVRVCPTHHSQTCTKSELRPMRCFSPDSTPGVSTSVMCCSSGTSSWAPWNFVRNPLPNCSKPLQCRSSTVQGSGSAMRHRKHRAMQLRSLASQSDATTQQSNKVFEQDNASRIE